MSKDIRALSPQLLWNKFSDLNAVPRPSKKEEQVVALMKEFGNSLGLEVIEDEVMNVIIKKPATLGMENRKTIVMQSHLDMVHQKNNDTVFDFDAEGIKMKIEEDWVKAEGTTLGADNGLGVATIMAILESKDIAHPAIEALFTIDEETGMTGAIGLKGGLLTGEILLNLDTEEDDEIGIGCAGGVDLTANGTYQTISSSGKGYQIKVKGLQGGHSGMQIHEGLGNANKLMNRILFELKDSLQIISIDGGGLRNAIPRESNAIVSVTDEGAFSNQFLEIKSKIMQEYKTLEPEMVIAAEPSEASGNAMSTEAQESLLKTIYSAHNGVYRMSPSVDGLVETSNNVARVEVKDGQITILCLTRSSVESGKQDLVNKLIATFEMSGYTVSASGQYPGWAPNPNSDILKVLEHKYQELFNEKPNVMACHAGLECGILGQNYPEMDMISYGPTIKGAHSPDERVSISSVQKFWKFTLEILKDIPVK